jgi:hypothetical protein
MRKLDVPALALLTEDGGVRLPADADYNRRATLTAISEQSAPGEDDIRVWFDVPLASGAILGSRYSGQRAASVRDTERLGRAPRLPPAIVEPYATRARTPTR